MSIVNKIMGYRWCLRSLLSSIYFNFHYLPWYQAYKLPILLYKPKFKALRGSIKIMGGATFGMIKLGLNMVNIYPNNGIMLELNGKLIFKGRCIIGGNSYISTGDKSQLIFGNEFDCSSSLKLVCIDRIEFSDRVLVGWDCLFVDTDFHKITREDGTNSKGYGPIFIGSDTWIANGCQFLKNTKLPNKVVVAACSVVRGNIDVPEKSLIGSQPPVTILANGRWFNRKSNAVVRN